MGSVGDCYDNSMVESFWGTMQLELLDSRTWRTRAELATAIFEWIECWYNPIRRHSSIGMLSPSRLRSSPRPRPTKITDPTPSVSGLRGQAHAGDRRRTGSGSQFVSPAKYLAAWRRMSRSVPSLCARPCAGRSRSSTPLPGARNAASSACADSARPARCPCGPTVSPVSLPRGGPGCSSGSSACTHTCSVCREIPRSAAIPRSVAPGVDRYRSTAWRRNSSV